MKFQQTKLTLQELGATLERIEKSIYEPIADLSVVGWTSQEPLPYADRQQGKMIPLKKGDKWGELFDCAWFRFTGTIPQSAAGKEVVLLIDFSGEGLVVDEHGEPAQGLTTVSSWYDFSLGKPGKRTVRVEGPINGGEPIDLWVDAGNNDLFGMFQNNGTLQEACIAICDEERQALFFDYSLLLEFLKELPEQSPRYQKVLYALWEAKNILSPLSPATIRRAREALARELERKNGDVSLAVSAFGHAHLDLAWLWPIRETIRKGARTFSTVLSLMQRYPEFHFCASQSQLYQWMKERYPSLYERVRTRIAEGRWEPANATWVEMDTNVPTGESLVRQFLYGKAFASTEFGRDIRILFLPDSFGYSGALPQIMKKSGVEYFVTTKLSWDRYNSYPHHTFFWEGIDGTRVLAHMPPEGTYNSSAAPRAIRKAETEYLDKAVSEECLLVFGIGDGGGGPGMEHLERLRRERDLESLPPVTQEPMEHFLDRLAENGNSYHTWSGELFLSCHQGTYTTQSRNKRHNRTMEIGLRHLEFVSVLGDVLGQFGYPREQCQSLWKETLLYQFHDILPGSSITRVYSETDARYSALEQEMNDAGARGMAHLQSLLDTRGYRRPVTVVNSLSWERREWVLIDRKWYSVIVPPLGACTVEGETAPPASPLLVANKGRLENEILKIEFNADGSISSIVDKLMNRQVIAHGAAANQLVVYEDRDDAWEVSWDYENRVLGTFALVDNQATLDGPQASIQNTYTFGDSTLVQRMVLHAGSRRLDFVTTLDWHEQHKMLRAIFPVNVRSNDANCEIQFGHIRRPTHRSTSWEDGKYEIPAQKWIDLSQRNYGVALLKDCKYGHRVSGNIMDINLLRSPTYPDPKADQGRHEFSYALFPHPGDHISGGVIRAAYEFNYPLRFIAGDAASGRYPSNFSFATVDAPNIIVETVKKAESADAVILRLYEAHGVDAEGTVSFGFPAKRAWLTNLLEEELSPVELVKNTVKVEAKPFEILTLKVEMQK